MMIRWWRAQSQAYGHPLLVVGLPVLLILRQPDLGTAMLIFLLFLSVMLLIKLKLRSMITLFMVAVLVASPDMVVPAQRLSEAAHFHLSQPELGSFGGGLAFAPIAFCHRLRKVDGQGGTCTVRRISCTSCPNVGPISPLRSGRKSGDSSVVPSSLRSTFFIILWAVKLASQARDRFGAVLCVGVAALFFWHTVINIGMVTGMMPVVGVTLPLIELWRLFGF